MSQELERVYTIPLGKATISQPQHRAVRAINMIREFARHHMKVETIKIDEELARSMWIRGVRNPPRKVRVRMSKTEEGYILVSKYVEEAESKTTKKESEKVSDKIETPKTETPKTETPAKETPKKEAPKKQAPKKQAPKKQAPKKQAPKKEAPKKD
ncbi:MAG: 50S ribosomal protein L31 [Nitrosopumilus sp.]|nr:50S ribosomal protein L31 [Nitrosopumilus sp.]MDF2428353.1 50S ribosomal protein L31 [Nitrosopumilus sp.]